MSRSSGAVRHALILAIVLLASLLAPAVAGAACPAPAVAESTPTPTPRAAGDDPKVTAPTDPTCDGGGYDVEFPDVPLEGGGASELDSAGGGGVVDPTADLPVTGVPTFTLVALALLGLLLVAEGVVVRRLATDLEA